MPELVSSQVQGGIAMGIDHALYEELPLYEDGPDNGKWNFDRYRLPRAKSRGLTIAQLSGALGRSVGWLSQVERGQTDPRSATSRPSPPSSASPSASSSGPRTSARRSAA